MIGLTGFLDWGEGVMGWQKGYGLRQSKHEKSVLHRYAVVKQNPRVEESAATLLAKLGAHAHPGEQNIPPDAYRNENDEDVRDKDCTQ